MQVALLRGLTRQVHEGSELRGGFIEEANRSLKGCEAMQVHESGEGRGSTNVQIKHLRQASGNHVIRFCCALWVYNCTGMPIAMQQVRPWSRDRRPSASVNIHTPEAPGFQIQ